MDVTLHVPVKRFVYKYITGKFNLKDGEPWKIGLRGKENIMLYSLLERAPNRHEKYKKSEAVLTILIPSRLNCLKGNFISQEHIDLYTNYIQDLIQDEIMLYYFGIKSGIGLKKCDRVVTAVFKYQGNEGKVRTRRVPRSEGEKFYAQNETIYDILKKYQITEDDLTFDSIIKHVQRSGLHNNHLRVNRL